MPESLQNATVVERLFLRSLVAQVPAARVLIVPLGKPTVVCVYLDLDLLGDLPARLWYVLNSQWCVKLRSSCCMCVTHEPYAPAEG